MSPSTFDASIVLPSFDPFFLCRKLLRLIFIDTFPSSSTQSRVTTFWAKQYFDIEIGSCIRPDGLDLNAHKSALALMLITLFIIDLKHSKSKGHYFFEVKLWWNSIKFLSFSLPISLAIYVSFLSLVVEEKSKKEYIIILNNLLILIISEDRKKKKKIKFSF